MRAARTSATTTAHVSGEKRRFGATGIEVSLGCGKRIFARKASRRCTTGLNMRFKCESGKNGGGQRSSDSDDNSARA
jgi:hypothetical protein